jgi:dihydroorotase
MIGLETALPLVITNLVKTGVLSLAEAIAKMTEAPAKALGLKSGTLTVGSVADVTVIDPQASVKVDISQSKSMAQNSPFDGAELTGKAVMTIVRGKVVYGADGLKGI